MATTLKQLGQLRPANTSAASIYSPGASTQTLIKSIIVANVSSGSMKYSLFVDDNGTTYDESTAIAWETTLAKGNSIVIDANIMMNDSTGNLAFQVDVASSATCTVFGTEIT